MYLKRMNTRKCLSEESNRTSVKADTRPGKVLQENRPWEHLFLHFRASKAKCMKIDDIFIELTTKAIFSREASPLLKTQLLVFTSEIKGDLTVYML